MFFFYTSPIGVLKITLKDHQIYSISKSKERETFKKSEEDIYNKKDFVLAQKITLFLDRYFFTASAKIKTWPLYFRGTVFQRKVWKILMSIPFGQTRTYSQVAVLAGSAEGRRAVGMACAKNPYLIIVPCHRVVAKKGLGGFSLGLSKKKWLLDLEKKIKICESG